MLNDIINKAKSAITSPSTFFQSVRKEQGMGEAIKFYVVMGSIYLILSTIAASVILTGVADIVSIIVGSVFAIIVIVPLLIISFITVGISHIFVSLLGGKNGFSQTYKAAAYGNSSTFVLGWIPVIGGLAALYSLYLFIKGISVLQNMSMGRAAAAVLIPLFVVIVLVVFIIGATLLAFTQTIQPVTGAVPV
jgi:hypothetical protein